MPSAVVLMHCRIGLEHSVLGTLRQIPEVSQSNIVFGGYDIVATVTADKMERLKEIVSWKIKKLDGVKTSLALLSKE